AGDRPVDALELERLGDVDRHDPRGRIRRADEMDVAHGVPPDVVDELTLALDEPLVLLARDALPDEALDGCLDTLQRGGTQGSPAGPLLLLSVMVVRSEPLGRQSRPSAACRRATELPPAHVLAPCPTAKTASMMLTYPVHRQMFPCSAARTSSSDGCGF